MYDLANGHSTPLGFGDQVLDDHDDGVRSYSPPVVLAETLSYGGFLKRDAMPTEPEATELDPTEDVGPEGCDPPPQQVELPVVHAGNAPEDCEFNIQDEVQEAYAPERVVMVASPIDGLPVPAEERSSLNLVLDPEFNYAHVCIGDEREYVELFREEIEARGIDVFNNAPLLTRGLYLGGGSDRERMRFPKERVVRRWGNTFVELTKEEFDALTAPVDEPGIDLVYKPYGDEKVLFAVRPARERCVYYKRQLFNTDGVAPHELGGKTRFDNCTHPSRRSVGGASMSLRGQCTYACDYRSPPDRESAERELDAHDRKRLSTPLEMVPLFGLK